MFPVNVGLYETQRNVRIFGSQEKQPRRKIFILILVLLQSYPVSKRKDLWFKIHISIHFSDYKEECQEKLLYIRSIAFLRYSRVSQKLLGIARHQEHFFQLDFYNQIKSNRKINVILFVFQLQRNIYFLQISIHVCNLSCK